MSDISQKRLLDWYSDSYRQLPWRETRDPYRILVSEVMLQQTQAERVVPKYHAFLDQFPTLHDLAAAPASDVIRAWAGLGYNRRALNLQKACRAVIERFDGVMPSDTADLASLPGIGPYTAGAIACFAFEQDVGFVDTNIRRVIHRFLAGPELPEPKMTAREIDLAASKMVPSGRGYEWNQALMELGATLCKARSAACDACPICGECWARETIQDLLTNTPRRTTHPTAKFETTRRYFRGRIIDALRAAGVDGMSFSEIGIAIKPDIVDGDALWLSELIAGLRTDGLLVQIDQQQRLLREEALPYDANGLDVATRYRLPD